MYIESIEIYGFKTFVNNTKFILSKGITCIVGPNGSGKSNIVDAIRFLFGENRLSLLRAGESSDLIFAGSTSKEPMNVASVKIVINNEDKILPIKTPRVIIERRIIRGKETKYIVNGNDSSLQSVQEIFKSSNIFGLTHAIVGQGRIEEILIAKPEEKKNIIDRVAGITDLRKRKEEAKKKLEETEENLAKASVALSSVKSEYDRVLREAKKVHIYYALTSELKSFEEKFYGLKLAKLRNELSTLKIGLAEKKKEESDIQKNMLEVKGKYEELSKKLEETQTLFEIQNQKREELTIKKNKLSNNIDSIKNLIEIKEKELTELNLRKERLEKTKSYILFDIEKNKQNIEKLKQEQLNIENEENVLKAQFTMKKNERDALEEEYNKFNRVLEQRESERVQIERKISAFEKELEFLKRKSDELEHKIIPLRDLKPIDLSLIDSELEKVNISIDEKKKIIEDKEKEIAVLEFRIKTLKNILDSATIPSFKDGTLGKLLNINKNLFGLKDYFEGVVVRSVNEIKKGNAKKYFLDLPLANNNEDNHGLEPISEVIGVNSKFLTGIFYTETLDEAIEKFKELQGKTFIRKIVTGDGYVVLSPFEVERSSGINVEEEHQYNAMLLELQTLKALVQDERVALNVLENRRRNLLNEQTNAKDIERKILERERLEDELEKNKSEIERLKNLLTELKNERGEKLKLNASFDFSKLTNIRDQTDKLKDEISKILMRKREIELKIQNIEKENSELQRRIESIERDLIELEEKKENILKEIDENEHTLNSQIALLNETELELKAISSEIEKVKSELNALKGQEGNLRIMLEKLNDEKESVRGAIERIELSIAKIEVNISNLLSELEEKGLKEVLVSEGLLEENLKKEIERLKSEIGSLQPLDFTSIDKEGELKANYEEKKIVFDDIVSAKKELEKYIEDLERTIKTKFESTFDSLNKHFERIFLEIFGDGEAKIEKIIDEFSEVKGVEISVRLPFKKKQPLSVLSGGEKSLVALAFLFAIFEVNPSPFYVLDEVDAALDDENVYKFGKLLENMSKKSQLIVITHNKQTMEKANVLYGITMEEAGVSKVVSLKFA
ncbi:AAA family ATPase [Caldisericum exile]|uniref:Chromosome partition protein Smc n=1 Tax=Caldisericum exile (strain DSM 21853 / NBRC 104410 / AZM16c01) TaxID=511051 RepID=A0A7U6JF52_CALEA|nr:AAA family ATPase [Caldisericum exile]BAL81411.1 chromosome partition protein SMC [Caldisericum exile AZM16c01]